MITQVPSYRTEDGRLFDNRSEATEHEFKLAVRGFIQQRNKCAAITVGQIVEMFAGGGFDEFYGMMQTHKRRMTTLANPRSKSTKKDFQMVETES